MIYDGGEAMSYDRGAWDGAIEADYEPCGETKSHFQHDSAKFGLEKLACSRDGRIVGMRDRTAGVGVGTWQRRSLVSDHALRCVKCVTLSVVGD